MRLYQSPVSSNARRAALAALELGADVELVPVDLAKGEQRRPAFLAMNPFGKVPVLDDGGFYVTESHAIMQYLADKTPGQTLYPRELQARTRVNRWLFWSAHHFAPSVAILNWEHFVKPFLGLGAAEPVLVKKGEAQVTECARLLDGELAGKTWLIEDGLTLADLAVATPLMSRVHGKLPLDDFKNIAAWFARIEARDSWKRTEPTFPPAK